MGTLTGFTCALLLALDFIQGSSANLNMNDICALVNNGLMIASVDACDAYYMCQGGIATRQSCTSGNYFNKETQACMPQEQVQCSAANAIPCSGADSLGSWAPVAGSCTDYYYCSLNGPERSSCPIGQYFNPNQQACVYPEQYQCVVSTATSGDSSSENSSTESSNEGSGSDYDSYDYGTTNSVNSTGDYSYEYRSSEDSSSISITITLPLNLCNFVKNGLFFGNPSSCNGWNKCVDNVLVSGLCPGSLLYNVLTMECEYPSVDSCSQVTNDPYLTSNSNTCPVNSILPGNTCDTYFVCDGSQYQVAQCPSGEFFDTVSNTCVNRLEARNDCDRCLGTTSSFVNMYSDTNCAGYLYCVNGVEVSSGYCPTGTYFDERSGVCLETSTDPLLGCCNPAYYNSTDADSTTVAYEDGSTVTDEDNTTDGNTTLSDETTTSSDVELASTTASA